MKNDKIPTPETDALVKKDEQANTTVWADYGNLADLSRDLERRLNVVRADLAQLRDPQRIEMESLKADILTVKARLDDAMQYEARLRELYTSANAKVELLLSLQQDLQSRMESMLSTKFATPLEEAEAELAHMTAYRDKWREKAEHLAIACKVWEDAASEADRKWADTGTEYACLRLDFEELREQVRLTIMENRHLADGDECTLKRLKDAIGFDLEDSLLNAKSIRAASNL